MISNMRVGSRVTVALCGVMMALICAPGSGAQAQSGATPLAPSADLAQRVQDLEKEIKDLRNELAAMKQTHGPRAIAEIASTTMPSLPASALEPLV